MSKRDEIKRKQWQEKLQAWEGSGLSGTVWCQENQENYRRFKYWKAILKQTDEQKSAFEELKDEFSAEANIEIRKGDLSIRLPTDCNQMLLEMCLITLRKPYC